MPGHSRTKLGPILSAVTSYRNQAHMIGPNFARPLAGKIGSNPPCCHLLPTGNQGNDGREDRTKFCQDTRGQNLAQSSLLSFPTGNQGRDGKEDRTKFCQDTLVPSSLLSLPIGTKQRGLDQILPGHSRAIFGPILSTGISYRCPRT